MIPATGPAVVMATEISDVLLREQSGQEKQMTVNFRHDSTKIAPENGNMDSATEDFHSSNVAVSGTTSPVEPEDDEKLEYSGDLQFKKKDLRKSRTHLFQSVLSTASLKLLKQQYASGTIQPLHRNSSNVGVNNQNNLKNFQSFIQAPVLSSVTNLREDDVEIGQQLPFDDRDDMEERTPVETFTTAVTQDDDIYREETMLQQQKLTLNALKKLSLSLAPIIRSDADEDVPRQLTTKLLNGRADYSRIATPYQPAQVDLSSFSSLTRQSKHIPDMASPPVSGVAQNVTKEPERDYHVAQRHNVQNHETVCEEQPPQVPPHFNLAFPVVPPLDMNVRNRKVSIQHEHVPNASKLALPDKKLQQIKGFRNPMYVPAVLRRTLEESEAVAPVTSGLDPESYFEQPVGSTNLESSSNSIRSVDLNFSGESVVSPASQAGPFTLHKKQYEHILRGAPSRKHWLKDESVALCGITLCRKHFNFFERRHHCRKCGGIFCKEHTSHYLYINHLAQFTTGGRGTLSRVCDNCIEEYNEFMKQEFGVSCHTPRSRESLPTKPKSVDFRKEIFKIKPAMATNNQSEDKGIDQLAGSVPANWSWSSF